MPSPVGDAELRSYGNAGVRSYRNTEVRTCCKKGKGDDAASAYVLRPLQLLFVSIYKGSDKRLRDRENGE
jgi:hypothetical protein